MLITMLLLPVDRLCLRASWDDMGLTRDDLQVLMSPRLQDKRCHKKI